VVALGAEVVTLFYCMIVCSSFMGVAVLD